MSIVQRISYTVVCDRCDSQHWCQWTTVADVSTEAFSDPTDIEQDAWTVNDGVHVCDTCNLRDREDACGARPQGHVWGVGWGWPPGEEKPYSMWCPGDEHHPTRRMRYCKDCNYSEKQEFETWFPPENADDLPWTNYRQTEGAV